MKSINKKIFLTFTVSFSILLGFLGAIFFYGHTRIKPSRTAYAEPPNALTDSPYLEELQNAYRKVAKFVLPQVVELDIIEEKEINVPDEADPFPWRFFFQTPEEEKNAPRQKPHPRKFRNQGLGSGIIVEKKGKTYYILTNNHVVKGSTSIKVKLYDKREFKGTLVGNDPRKDLAVVSFESPDESISTARLGNSDNVRVGDFVLAVGNPFGFTSSVTSGIISAVGRYSNVSENINDFIQTDAPINRGNSGGPLVNIYGEIIGINTWISTPSGASAGLGFSIPINNAKRAIRDFISKGKIQYGWLGVSISDISPEIMKELSAPQNSILINQVFTGSPADKSGILPGDVIYAIDGKPTLNRDNLIYVIGDTEPGKKITFSVLRNGKKIRVPVTIVSRQPEEKVKTLKGSWPGFNALALTDPRREELKVEKNVNGVIVQQIYKQSKFYVGGLQTGDVIIKINQKKINNLRDFFAAINANKKFQITFIRSGIKMETPIILR